MTTLIAHRESPYRNTYTALWLIAALGLAVLTALNRPLFAVAVYAAAVLGTFAVYYGYGETLFDERDAEYQQRAGSLTLALYGWAAAIVFPRSPFSTVWDTSSGGRGPPPPRSSSPPSTSRTVSSG